MKVVCGLGWNPKTNEFAEVYVDEEIERLNKELAFWRTVYKTTKVDHKKKKALNWSLYLISQIDSVIKYEKWYVEKYYAVEGDLHDATIREATITTATIGNTSQSEG